MWFPRKGIVVWIALAGLLGVFAGCGEPPPPLPCAPKAGEAKILEGWTAVTNAAQVKAMFLTPGARFATNGVVELTTDFSGKNPPARANWDIKLPCDLRLRPGIQFDFHCDDLSQFSSFSCYFRSGDGWYNCPFSPEEEGGWERVTVSKALASPEGRPAGWGEISAIRISGWRAGTGRVRCALANVSVIGGKPDVAVVYADSLAVKGVGDVKSYMGFAGTLASSLRAVGVEPLIVADRDLKAEMLKGLEAVILPYNPEVPSETLALVKDHVAAGGRLLACYAQPREVFDLLDVRNRGPRRPTDNGGAAIAGFLKTGWGLPGQPEFAPQASWMTMVPVCGSNAEVVAQWADGKRASLGIPALVRSRAGFYMSHVWLGGTEGPQAELLRALMADLAPSLKAKLAAREAEARRKEQEMRVWLADRPSRPGEHRAFWCHSARGLGGDRDWDASIAFLKENGFNVIIPNLCWGGVAFYQSKVLPVSPEVAIRGDAFVQCRDACRRHGVKMHVWKVCWNMGAYTSKEFENRMKAAGRTQVDAHGKDYSRWLCPSHPENRQLEIEAMVELAKKGPDGVHFDYIRYPGGETCFCAGCRARFEAQLGKRVENWPADVRNEKLPIRRAWLDFRADNISKVVETVARRVRAEAPGVQISAALFRNPVSDSATVAQDWPRWCREGWLDFACNMDYVDSAALFASQVRIQRQAVGKVKIYPGIGLSCWANDGRDAVKLAKQIQVTRDLGLGGFTVFNFDRRAERVLPLMRTGVTRED